MTRAELIAWATADGWQPDRWGHLRKQFANGTHRLRLTRLAVRQEIDTPFGWAVLNRVSFTETHNSAATILAALIQTTKETH